MGTEHARGVVARRPKWRAYLLLSRVSNLPTVWSNVLAGFVASGGTWAPSTLTRVSVAVSLLYTAGMFLNDGFDRAADAVHRSDRPLPAGDVTPAEVFGIGAALLAGGELLLAWTVPAAAALWGFALATAIVYYDYQHKQNRFGPLVMGVCRGLVYCLSAAAVGVVVSIPIAVAAVVMAGYVVVLTGIAKSTGPRGGWLIPWLIAGISLVDAGVVLANGGGSVALLAAAGFVLTLVLQRVVPGT